MGRCSKKRQHGYDAAIRKQCAHTLDMIIAALYLRAEAAEAAALKARHDVLASAELRGERLEPVLTQISMVWQMQLMIIKG